MKRTAILFSFLFFVSYLSFSQNVGIGITNPTRAKLEVNGAVGYTTAIFGGESTGIGIFRNNPSIGFNDYFSTGHRYIANGYSGSMWFDAINGAIFFDVFGYGNANTSPTTGVNSMVINNTGNVAIRTYQTANASLYAVKAGNSDGSAIFGGTTYGSYFHYGSSEDTYIRGGKSTSKVIINDIPGGKILLGNGNTLVSIDNGIPSYPLEIREISEYGPLFVEPVNSFNNWEMRVGLYSVPSGPDLMMIYNGQYKSGIECGTGYPYTFSDKRLKTNIRDLSGIMEKFMQLAPVEYEMKDQKTTHKKTMGFIAQDVQKLFPQLVTVTKNTRHGYSGIDELYGINYNGFRILAIEALREQQEKIKKMQQQNDELSKRIATAEALLANEK